MNCYVVYSPVIIKMFESIDLPIKETFGTLARLGYRPKMTITGQLFGMYNPNQGFGEIFKVFAVFDIKELKTQIQELTEYCDELFYHYLIKHGIRFRSTYEKDKKHKKIFYHILNKSDKTIAVISINRNKPVRPRYVNVWRHFDLLPWNYELIEFMVEDIKATLGRYRYID